LPQTKERTGPIVVRQVQLDVTVKQPEPDFRRLAAQENNGSFFVGDPNEIAFDLCRQLHRQADSHQCLFYSSLNGGLIPHHMASTLPLSRPVPPPPPTPPKGFARCVA